jgi:hypothetical protein
MNEDPGAAAKSLGASSKAFIRDMKRTSLSESIGFTDEEMARRKEEIKSDHKFQSGSKWFKSFSYSRSKQTYTQGAAAGERRMKAKELVTAREQFRTIRYTIAACSVGLLAYMTYYHMLPMYVIQLERRKRFELRALRAAEARQALLASKKATITSDSNEERVL